jgi:DnaK suppressor protein
MDKKTLAKYKKMLEERRQSLIDAYTKNKSMGTEAGGDEVAADMVDMATNASTKEFLYSLSNAEREMLKSVEDALERLDGGDYGACEECEEKMTKKRLDAIPWARYCVACQELVESGRLES